MPKRRKHDIRIYGEQREHIDPELMAQIVLMLAHQLAEEARQEQRQRAEPMEPGQAGDEETPW